MSNQNDDHDSKAQSPSPHEELTNLLHGSNIPKIVRFFLAVAGGAIPIFGGFASGTGGAWSEHDQERINRLFEVWMKLQEDEMKEIGQTLGEVLMRLDLNDVEVIQRIESPQYLSLIKKAFRDWSAAESEEKRVLIRNLLSNAAASRITSDDVVKLFIKWIDEYSEAHFAVIKAIYNHDGSTRAEVWDRIHGVSVRENSAEADLFKLLFHDLSTGHIIRQHRETDADGHFLKQSQRGKHQIPSRVMASAFDDDKPYELTELGTQFVHYTMNEIVPRISASTHQDNETTENVT